MATSPTTAVSAASFLNSLGVNVHMWEDTSGYGNISLVESSLAYLGILNVRDNYIPASLPDFTALANAGYKLDLAIPSDAITISNFVTQIDAFSAAHPGSIVAIEGPNEVNVFPVTYNGGSSLANTAQYQKAFYSAVRADHHLDNIPVYNMSLAYLDSSQYAQVGNLSGSANYANSHAYLNDAYAPQWSLNIILPFAKLDASSLPTVITETGYNTDPNDNYSGLSQTVQAKYTLDTLMDAYKDGVKATYLYELFDEFSDPNNTDAQNHFGLFNADGSPKLAATAIHNLTTILADPGASSSFTPGSLNYSVSNLTTAYGNQMLLQKSNGTFDLVLWAEPSIYNPSTEAEIAAPHDKVTVNFAQLEATVNVYDPLLGNTPIATYHNVQQVQVDITDHPLVVEVSNGSTTLPPPPPPSTVMIESFGSTSLAEVGNDFFLDNSAGSGPELKYQGTPAVAGQFPGWIAIGAEQTSAGYEVAWHNTSVGQYTVWNTDSSGNYLSNTGNLSGSSSTLQSLETSFHQDLNGDGVIGVPTPSTVVESFGSTSLAEVGNNFFLENSAGSGPELKYQGAPVVAGQFSGWTPIGAEHTANGYEVAWHNTSIGQYTVWNTDSSGNYLSNTGNLAGSSSTLQSLETSFHQDLNGDGVIGVPTPSTVVESFGSTSLAEVGNNFFLENSAGSGPELKYQGAPVVAGQFSGWTPIGAEHTANGYEVAWHNTSIGQYTVWNTDSSGSYLSNTGNLSASSSTLQSLETSFHQDLNGDGVIGLGSLIESFGSTTLAQVGNNYFLENSTGVGPSLKYGGAPVVSGQFPGWTPIGAEQTATGYEVAWHNTSTNQYTVWNTDSNGNSASNIGNVSGSSAALESLETSFHQDLNGDGHIGQNPAGAPSNDVLVASVLGGTLTGGAGNDTFVFNSVPSTPSAITDFTSGHDLLQISAAGFGHGLSAGETPTLVTGVPTAVVHSGSDGYFIFDNSDPHGGTLYWDATGGSGTDATAVVHLQSVAMLHLSDFHLV